MKEGEMDRKKVRERGEREWERKKKVKERERDLVKVSRISRLSLSKIHEIFEKLNFL